MDIGRLTGNLRGLRLNDYCQHFYLRPADDLSRKKIAKKDLEYNISHKSGYLDFHIFT